MTTQGNRLAREPSPYLRQHADNPVDWYPWGMEAFTRAKMEDKPIFLSIGYSTCHWCHVMAEESFANPQSAARLNRWYVAIKVDREERPDIDQLYMAATHAMTGSGGWPMSVFLLPDGRPFYATTYVPRQSMPGRPGFLELLTTLHEAWQDQRDQLVSSAEGLSAAIRESATLTPRSVETADFSGRAQELLAGEYDARYGGFGRAPKFPRPAALRFLCQRHLHTCNEDLLAMCLHTLRAMARGGMHDQLAGGFHRYSVDHRWRIPHFEKMLYDQSQLVQVYLDACLLGGDEEFRRIAEQTLDYVVRDLTGEHGGIFSAEDADSQDPDHPEQHGEGRFYLWREEEIVRTLGRRQATWFNYCFGVEFDGNALNDPQQEFAGRNVLYRRRSPEEAAEHFGESPDRIRASLQASFARLLARRSQRPRPGRDEKVITAWNGLMIGALARGGIILGRPDLVAAAQRSTAFIKHRLTSRDGRLLRRWAAGRSGCVGQLDDYANLVSGLLDLYQVVHEPDLLRWALDLTRIQCQLFRDEANGALFDSVEDSLVCLRLKATYDGAEPAPNSTTVNNLLLLSAMTGDGQWRIKAREILDALLGRIESYAAAMPTLLCGLDQLASPVQRVLVVANRGSEADALLRLVHSAYAPGRPVLFAEGGRNQELLVELHPELGTTVPGKPAVRLYRNGRWSEDLAMGEGLRRQLGLRPLQTGSDPGANPSF